MDQNNIEQWLSGTLEDFKLSQSEVLELRELLPQLSTDQTSFVRNKAFLLARDIIRLGGDNAVSTLIWLEKIVKTIDSSRLEKEVIESSAHFSPGEDCRRKLLDLLVSAKTTIDISVFTISDDRLAEAINVAHQRGVFVRIITDNDKANDLGSDIHYLINKGIDVRMDNADSHMHHKFAVVDKKILVNGSFNWTRSASEYNQENILVTDESKLVSAYLDEFESLWKEFS